MRAGLYPFLFLIPTSLHAATLDVQVVDSTGRPLVDAVVSVAPASARTGAPRFDFASRVEQRNVQFQPGLLVVPVGTTVRFPNLDRVRHHVYSFSKAKKFDLKLYGRDESHSVRFDQPGTVALGCNIHDSMRGFIRVVNTPWAGKTNAAGRVSFTDLPPGGAQLIVWHSLARARENEVTTSIAIPANGRQARIVRMQVAR